MPDGETPTQPETKPTTPEPEGRTFSQADVNKIVSDRLQREREKLGDVDELRRKATEFDKFQESQRSESEKAAAKFADLEKRYATAERELQEQRIRQTVTAAAAKGAFHDPEDAWRLIDLADIQYDKDGQPTNLDKLLEGLAESKPHLVRAEAPQGPGSGDGGARGKPRTSDPGETFGRLIADRLRR